MRLKFDFCLVIFIFLLLGVSWIPVAGQTSPPASLPSNDSDTSFNVAEDLVALDGPELPQRGFNASVAFSGMHDSQLGWAAFTQPAISYRFNRIFSTDATIPIYFFRNGFKYNPNKPILPINNPLQSANNRLSTQYGELGDTTIAGHAQFSPGWLNYTPTAAFNAPTGDKNYGLSTGRVTYEITNDFETSIKRFTPDLQLGIGDNSDLVNRRVLRNYDTLGELAYFQAGSALNLPRSWILDGDAYEQLPIGHQKLYTNVIVRKKLPLFVSNSSAEDNGVTVSLNSPPARHFQISSYYNRSIRLSDDTVALALTFQLKAEKIAILPQIP